MFSYYGGKSAIAHLYPAPKYDTIIEPFAGSAAYSLQYHLRNVVLLDINPVIHRIWNWIINDATIKDVEKWPVLNRSEDLRSHKYLSQPEREILGFCVNRGGASPCNIVTPFASRQWSDKNGNLIFELPNMEVPNSGRLSKIETIKKQLKYYIPRIKHWKCLLIDYKKYKTNKQSTWFVDPPYSTPAGRKYPFSDINYDHLANWCNSRKGQVIVCGQQGENWLPFNQIPKIGKTRGCQKTLTEVMWTNAKK